MDRNYRQALYTRIQYEERYWKETKEEIRKGKREREFSGFFYCIRSMLLELNLSHINTTKQVIDSILSSLSKIANANPRMKNFCHTNL